MRGVNVSVVLRLTDRLHEGRATIEAEVEDVEAREKGKIKAKRERVLVMQPVRRGRGRGIYDGGMRGMKLGAGSWRAQ
jgi:hypothetical protein